MSAARIALDLSQAKLEGIGVSVYIWRLYDALAALLGERLVPIASRFARPVHGARRTTGERMATLVRDLWWHQAGVTIAARRRGCGLLHAPGGVGPIAGSFPAVVTVHDVMPIRFPQLFRPWYRRYAGVVMPRLARRARAVIAVSSAAKAEIVEWLRVPAERVTVVPHGVDPVFRPLAPEDPVAADVRRRYALPREFVLAVGTIAPRKNLPRLLEALGHVRSQAGGRGGASTLALVHAGPEGWRPEEVTRAVAALGLGDAVRFLGYVPVEDLRVLYGLARVLAYPSLWEGFGMPVLEAMACGCPVVTSNVSSLPEVAGDAAVLVDPGSTEDLARGIAAVWCDEGRRGRLIAQGLVRAREFTWTRAARETAAVYDTALA
ncbi:MAG: glycosyltransferase family 1 protein [Gemmatimonadales bacterium]